MSDEELLQLLLQEKLDQLQNIYSVPDDKDIIKKQLTALQKVKKDLEILNLIIKWKDYIHFDNCYDFLIDEEIKELESDIHFLINYLAHYKGYTPKCFRKVGDSYD